MKIGVLLIEAFILFILNFIYSTFRVSIVV